jgi:hypothetical protein
MPLLESLPVVQLCHSVAGDTELMVLAHADTPTALADLRERIAAFKGVDDVSTVPVLRVMLDRQQADEVVAKKAQAIRVRERIRCK